MEKSFGRNMEIKYFSEVNGARQLFWNTLRTDKEVFVYSEFGRSKFVGKRFYKSFVARSKEIGFRERVIINPKPRVINLLKRDNNTPLARTKVETMRAVETKTFRIKGESFIYDDVYAVVYLQDCKIEGFEIKSMHFSLMQKRMWGTMWDLGVPVDKILVAKRCDKM
jgi:hypothetical protein